MMAPMPKPAYDALLTVFVVIPGLLAALVCFSWARRLAMFAIIVGALYWHYH